MCSGAPRPRLVSSHTSVLHRMAQYSTYACTVHPKNLYSADLSVSYAHTAVLQPSGKEVLRLEDVIALSDRFCFFNQHIELPKFASEEEVSEHNCFVPLCEMRAQRDIVVCSRRRLFLRQVLSVTELDMVQTHVANHKAYLDQGFVRKVSSRWNQVYKNQRGGAAGGNGQNTSLIHTDVADTSGTKWDPIAKARPHSQWVRARTLFPTGHKHTPVVRV